jgi:HptB-dependent secretion and biofilm anti anti-sigma factor
MSISSVMSEDMQSVTIKVAGRFDFSTHHDFVQTYKGYPKGEKSFVVDLACAEYMDSSAMGMLLQLREYNKQGENVVLANVNDAVKDVLGIANFGKLFSIA